MNLLLVKNKTWFLFIMLSLIALRCWGQDDSLKISVVQPVNQPRMNAPLPVDLLFDWQGLAILTGRVRFVIRGREGVLCDHTTQEISITTGNQKRSFLLPAVTLDADFDKPALSIEFITAEHTWTFDDQILFYPNYMKRNWVIAVVKGKDNILDDRWSIAKYLRLEPYFPDYSTSKKTATLNTSVNTMDIDAVPDNPLKFCSYNLLLLRNEGFVELSKKRLLAIKRWVLAGGSVLVIPEERPVNETHEQFINDLVKESDKPEAVVQLTSQKRLKLLTADKKTQALGLYRAGLGRMVVILKPFDIEKQKNEKWWLRCVALLWKLRYERAEILIESGELFPEENKIENVSDNIKDTKVKGVKVGSKKSRIKRIFSPNSAGMDFYYRDDAWLDMCGFVNLEVSGQILQRLAPENIKMLSFRQITLFLALFLLLIGPVDYYLLGILRKRRYTWIVFPVLSFLFFFLFYGLSDYYIGDSDNLRSFTIVDLGRSGQVLRKNRIDLMFYGTQKNIENKLDNSIFTAFMPKGSSLNRYYAHSQGENMLVKMKHTKDIGSYPFKYNYTYPLAQWTLCFQRTLSFPENQIIDCQKWGGLGDNQKAFIQFYRQVKLPEKTIGMAVYQAGELVGMIGDLDGRKWQGVDILLDKNLAYVNVTSHNFFSIVTGIAPTGGRSFEDFAIADNQNPEEKLLILVTADKNKNYTVYRKLYF